MSDLTTARALAHDLLTMTLHGAPPPQTTMTIAQALVDLGRRYDEVVKERDEAHRVLYSEGYSPCSLAECNCGSWHGGHTAELRARLRATAQMLTAEVGAGGPMNAEAAAEKAVAVILGLREERDRYKPTTIALHKQRAADVAAIVAWVRALADKVDNSTQSGMMMARIFRAEIADAIERGDWNPDPLPPDPREEEIANPAYLAAIAQIEADAKVTCADCRRMGPHGCENIPKAAAFRCTYGPPSSDRKPLPYARRDCAGFKEKP